MKKTVQFEIAYESEMVNSREFNKLCDFKTMSIFNGIPTKGVFNQSSSKIEYAIKKITVK